MFDTAFSGTFTAGITAKSAFAKGVKKFFESLLESIPSQKEELLAVLQLDGSKNPFEGVSIQLTTTLTNYAYIICAIVFMIEFLKYTIKIEGVKLEYVAGLGFKFAVARSALDIGRDLLLAITATANSLVLSAVNTQAVYYAYDSSGKLVSQSVTGGISENIEAIKTLINKTLEDAGMFDAIVPLITLSLPFIAIKVIMFIGIIMAYGRMFEMTIYQIMYPLPCGMMLLDQGRIPKRFFASYCACALQGPIMIMSVSLFEGFMTRAVAEAETVQDLSAVAFTTLMAALMMLMGMLKSGQWANRVLGES
ncbi:hypothetical protein [Ruminococcus sp.]|uniref:hypothetical protein n=1 Tax=Ruminococcus sp. TaxID=41978 RepID=UPI0025D69AF0|nr:hypothetical protein [Ruminococcus sp.]MBQ8967280.1 hypothetical protein [Ruminococcus sp.]